MVVTKENSPVFDGIWHSGNGDAHVIPDAWMLCPRCNGEGKHGNPAFDGMSMSELHEQDHWDDDFMDGYMSGRYDVTCEECKGRTTVKGYDLSQLTPEVLEEYFADVREIATQRYEDFKTYQAEMGYRPY